MKVAAADVFALPAGNASRMSGGQVPHRYRKATVQRIRRRELASIGSMKKLLGLPGGDSSQLPRAAIKLRRPCSCLAAILVQSLAATNMLDTVTISGLLVFALLMAMP